MAGLVVVAIYITLFVLNITVLHSLILIITIKYYILNTIISSHLIHISAVTPWTAQLPLIILRKFFCLFCFL